MYVDIVVVFRLFKVKKNCFIIHIGYIHEGTLTLNGISDISDMMFTLINHQTHGRYRTVSETPEGLLARLFFIQNSFQVPPLCDLKIKINTAGMNGF